MLAAQEHLELEDRVLGPGAEASLAAFLAGREDSALLMESNFRQAGLRDQGDLYQGSYAARLRHGVITGVVAHYWNGLAVIESSDGCDSLVVQAVARSGRVLSGLIGPREQLETVVRTLDLTARPLPALEGQELLALALSDLKVPDRLTEGQVRCRRPRSGELELLMNWRVDYCQELYEVPDTLALHADAQREILRYFDDRALWVLERKGRIVSFCCALARTPARVKIGGVYTPPALRGRGFARAVVAGALLQEHEFGRRRACLWSGNAAAKRAYGALGFEPIAEFGCIMVEDGG